MKHGEILKSWFSKNNMKQQELVNRAQKLKELHGRNIDSAYVSYLLKKTTFNDSDFKLLEPLPCTR